MSVRYLKSTWQRRAESSISNDLHIADDFARIFGT